jgi:hypothetical protein
LIKPYLLLARSRAPVQLQHAALIDFGKEFGIDHTEKRKAGGKALLSPLFNKDPLKSVKLKRPPFGKGIAWQLAAHFWRIFTGQSKEKPTG